MTALLLYPAWKFVRSDPFAAVRRTRVNISEVAHICGRLRSWLIGSSQKPPHVLSKLTLFPRGDPKEPRNREDVPSTVLLPPKTIPLDMANLGTKHRRSGDSLELWGCAEFGLSVSVPDAKSRRSRLLTRGIDASPRRVGTRKVFGSILCPHALALHLSRRWCLPEPVKFEFSEAA